MSPASKAARERLAAFAPHAAVVFGSGLAAMPQRSTPLDELGYDELGWPCTAVPGHANKLVLATMPSDGTAGLGARLRLALACGRPHGYEGWSGDELERPVRELVAAGAHIVLLTNSCGALRPEVSPGEVVVAGEVVDLQSAPERAPERLSVCDAETSERLVARAGEVCTVRRGTYVAVPGPQFETAAEVAWLAAFGDVVGMSAAPEVRAARAAGAACRLLALVVNRAAAVDSHADVLAAGGRIAETLARLVPLVLEDRGAAGRRSEGGAWTS